MFLDSLHDLDLLLVPIKRKFAYKNLPDLMTDDKHMKGFLHCARNAETAANWLASSGTDYQTTYAAITAAFDNVSLSGALTRRQELVTSGIMQVFAQNYDAHALPVSVETTDLRDINSEAYLRRMRQYTDACVSGVKEVLQLEAEDVEEGSWRQQIRSKIRFLTSARGGMPPRPFLCVQLLLHIHRELCRTPDAIKEVCISILRKSGEAGFRKLAVQSQGTSQKPLQSLRDRAK